MRGRGGGHWRLVDGHAVVKAAMRQEEAHPHLQRRAAAAAAAGTEQGPGGYAYQGQQPAPQPCMRVHGSIAHASLGFKCSDHDPMASYT